jgi:hypothetical protein
MRRSPSALLSVSSLSTLIFCIMIFSTLSFAAAPDRVTRAIDSSQSVALAKSLHPQAQPQYDHGLVDPSRELSYITLLMAPSASQQMALNQLLAQQQDPKSPNYHKWLTPQQYADRFGLSPNDLNRIATWLTSQGFQILSIGGGHNSIVFSGTVAEVQWAFGTEMHSYNVDGQEHFANSTPLKIPAVLSGIATGVIGLHDFRLQPASGGRRFIGMQNGRPDYHDGSYIFPNFLAPGDIATIYHLTSLYTAPTPIDGTGQKLAIVGQSDIYLADINDFRSGFGLSTIPTTGAGACTIDANGLVISPCSTTNFAYVLVGTDPHVPSSGDLSESDLDIEWSGAVARNAQIVFVNAPATAGGVLDSISAVINPPSGPPLASVVSMSYGACEAQAFDQETLFQQGNAEGVTIVNSSGDSGSTTCDRSPNSSRPYNPAIQGLAVSYPASSPEVTGVGGTSISLANDSYPTPSSFWSTTIGANGGTAVSYIPELPWNDDETLAQYCHAPASGDTFCSTGSGRSGWVPLTASATAAQVQEDIWISQGGGGASNCFTETVGGICQAGFPKPTWQPTVPSAPAGVRYVPDVSLFASPDFPGYILCTPQSEIVLGGGSASTCVTSIFDAVDNFGSIIGGTSASAPVFAGIVTLLNQDVVLSGVQSAPGLGNINPNLYKLAANSPAAFHQVTTGDNMVYCQVGTPAGQPAGIVCPAAGVFGYQASNKDSATGYNLVTGLGSVVADTLLADWVASASSFSLSASPSTLSITPGLAGGTSTITVNPTGGFASSVSLVASGLPNGVTASFNPTSTTTTSILTLTASALATAGTATVTITGTSGILTHTTTIALTVTPPPDFTLAANQPTLSLNQGTNRTDAITVVPTNGFTGSVTLAASGLPSGVTAGFIPNPTTTTSTLTLTASNSATPGTATVIITGTSGSLIHTTTIALTVNQNFTLSTPTTPAPSPVAAGLSATSTFNVTSADGKTFASAVTFACNGLPDATVTCAFSSVAQGATSPQPITLTIKTTGPNGPPRAPRQRADHRSPWLPLALPLAGIVMVGLTGRKLSRYSAIAGLSVSLALLGLLLACGSGSTPPPVGISVSPAGATVFASGLAGSTWPPQTATFAATVTNNTNTAVNWSVSPANGGSITSGGVYTAPTIAVGLPGSATITATSQADSTKTAHATVTITPTTVPGSYPLTVTATEGPVTSAPSGQFTLTVN